MEVKLCNFDHVFLETSWKWLQDEELRKLVDAPVFTKDQQKNWFKNLLKRTDYRIWGVLCDGNPVGATGLKNITNNTGEYWGYVGDKSYWGKGVGSAMMQSAIAEAFSLHLKHLKLKVLRTNQRAIKLYLNNGFVQTHANETHLLMEKAISSNFVSRFKDEWIEVTTEDYEQVVQHPYHAFNSSAFTRLNSSKCDESINLLYKDTKYRLGLTAGIRGGILISPFSSPFGGFSFLKKNVQIDVIEKAVEKLEEFCLSKSYSGIRLILPPMIYNESFIAKQFNVLYRMGYKNTNLDLDFYIPLQTGTSYEDLLWYNAKKNLRISSQQSFEVALCNDDLRLQQTIFDIIKENRSSKGNPMNMSYSEIRATASVIPTDFFLLKRGDECIAGGIVYKISSGIRYVPFWGDRPGYTSQKPMNFLSHFIADYYRRAGERHLHIGISTEKSVPNYGLCEFKESIGCTVTPKLSFEKYF